MNPASQIVKKVFPSFPNPSDRIEPMRRNSHNSFGITGGKFEDTNTNAQQIQRLRETVFKLNMDIAACRGQKQRLEKTVHSHESMESYYLTEMEVRKARADCLETQLALVLEEFPSHKPLRAPEKTEGCQGCEDSERIITKLAHELNLKNQLLILLDNSYKQIIEKVSLCLKEHKSQVENLEPDEDKENVDLRKDQSIETQTQSIRRPLQPSENSHRKELRPYKKSKVILKRVMPQRQNSANFERHSDR